MRHRLFGLLCLGFAVCAPVAAAEFWDTKPFLEWSNKEVEKMMTDSPWATIVSVALPPRLPTPSDFGGGGRGGGDERSFGPGPQRIRVTLSWRSALPMKQALVRGSAGQRGTLSPENQTFLTQEEQFYVVALSGLPPQYMRPGGVTVESFLRPKEKPPIPAEQAGVQKSSGGAVLLIGFPRTDPITIGDDEVEFGVKFEELEIKRKFSLEKMVFGGKLEL